MTIAVIIAVAWAWTSTLAAVFLGVRVIRLYDRVTRLEIENAALKAHARNGATSGGDGR